MQFVDIIGKRPMGTLLACAVAAGLAPGEARSSCGSAFCMVNTNWNLQGMAAEPGLRLDLRYEYIEQDQLRSGSSKVAVGQFPRDHDELKTINRNLIGTFDYTFNDRWGVSATAPWTKRFHAHLHNNDDGTTEPEQWDFSDLGDIRVLGRYQLRSENQEHGTLSFYGLNFGLKLPSGKRDVVNAEGERAERTLQPGTGTTDALIGAYFSQALGHLDSSWFAQALWQAPLASREDFRPGQRFSVDVGYRYEATSRIGLMLQLNALHKGKDSGAQAEPEDSGGRFLFVSPGISVAVGKALQLYTFVQLPLYQHVNGVQLTSSSAVVAGVSARF